MGNNKNIQIIPKFGLGEKIVFSPFPDKEYSIDSIIIRTGKRISYGCVDALINKKEFDEEEITSTQKKQKIGFIIKTK